jgi:hypothetical protein
MQISKIDFLFFLLIISIGCTSQREQTNTTRDSRYPAHWWAPVSKEGASEWEILPQEAGPGEVIVSKRHELGLLSNFAATPFTFRDFFFFDDCISRANW